MKRIAIALGGTIALGACIGASLENAPCKTADDCAGSYQCVYTETEKLAADGVGLCRPDSSCAVGRQDGCAVFGNACEDEDLAIVCDPDSDACFCCNLYHDVFDAILADDPVAGIGQIAPDGMSAVCVVCRADSCEAPLEPCLDGDDRCEVDDDDDECGCRVKEEDIENSACESDDDCGGGDYPTCATGLQSGCKIATGYDSCTDLSQYCNARGQCFCCAPQTEASGFVHQVYAVAEDGSSAACTACPYCDDGNTCTLETDPTCVLADNSVCGCTPPPG
jgi:hypothetical protein